MKYFGYFLELHDLHVCFRCIDHNTKVNDLAVVNLIKNELVSVTNDAEEQSTEYRMVSEWVW